MGLDEAYIEFVEEPGFVSGLELLTEFPNVVTIRTFSKIYGLAGMRVGYGIAGADIVTLIQKSGRCSMSIRSPNWARWLHWMIRNLSGGWRF